MGVRQAHLSLCHQVFSRHHHITEPGDYIKSLGVFGKLSVAHFVVTEDSFDVEKAVLNFRTHTCFKSFQFCNRIAFRQIRPLSWTHGDLPVNRSPLMFGPLPNPKIPGIAPDSLLFAVQKLISYRNIMNIRRRGGDAVNQA